MGALGVMVTEPLLPTVVIDVAPPGFKLRAGPPVSVTAPSAIDPAVTVSDVPVTVRPLVEHVTLAALLITDVPLLEHAPAEVTANVPAFNVAPPIVMEEGEEVPVKPTAVKVVPLLAVKAAPKVAGTAQLYEPVPLVVSAVAENDVVTNTVVAVLVETVRDEVPVTAPRLKVVVDVVIVNTPPLDTVDVHVTPAPSKLHAAVLQVQAPALTAPLAVS